MLQAQTPCAQRENTNWRFITALHKGAGSEPQHGREGALTGDSAVTVLSGAWPPSAAPVQGQLCSLCHVGEVAAAAVSGHGEPRHEHRVWPQGSKSYKLFPQVHRTPKDEICQDSHGWGPLTTTSSLPAHLSHHSHRVVVVLSKAEANVRSL